MQCILITSHAQDKFPPYEKIVHEFFGRYDLKENQKQQDIRFVKKKEGYFIEEYNRENRVYSVGVLFWSANKGKYKKVKFPKGKNSENEIIEKVLKAWGADKFDLYPYYGYVNWEQDVIDYFESKEHLTNDELYALGRSYSNAATNLINNNTGFADTLRMFKLLEYGKNQFDKEEIARYRHYRHKAIETFGKLCELEPDYKTIVGSICNKYYNEFLTSFLDIRVYHNDIEAIKELPDSIYSSFYLEMARNYLNSCDNNSILFTNGDNDTYPLLYLQSKYNYRPDILVVNLMLLNNNNYVNHFRYGKILESDSLRMVLSPKNYSGYKQAYTLIKQNSADNGFIDLAEALKLIRDESPLTENNDYPDYRYLVSDKLKISLDSTRTIKFLLENRYISKGELIALDMINSNISERPVYFLYNKSLGLTDNMELNGFAYKLVDSTNIINDYQLFGGIKANKTFNQLMLDFKFGENFESDINTQAIVISTYQRSFCHLAKYYADSGEKDSCLLVIKRYFEILPNSIYKMDLGLLPMIDAAYDAGLIFEGDSIAATILNNLDLKINTQEFSERDVQVIRYTAGELKNLTKNEELLQSIDEILSEI